MTFETLIVIAVIITILGLAINKIIKDKKAGNKCAGCPYAGECNSCKSLEKLISENKTI